MKNKNLIILFNLFLIVCLSSIAYSQIDTEAGGFRIPKDGEKEINTSYSHLVIRNFCENDVFVPTRTKREFDYFISNRPECLERWKCSERISELNNQIYCAPKTSIFLSWQAYSNTAVGLTYCVLNDSRIVETAIEQIDYGEIIENLKNDIQNRLTIANTEITDLQSDFDNGILTDDGIPLRLNSARELTTNIQNALNDGNFGLATQLLDEVETLILMIPFDSNTLEEVKVETESDFPELTIKYNNFKAEISGNFINVNIQNKINNLDIKYGLAQQYYNDGQLEYLAQNNESARTNFILSLDNVNIARPLIDEINNDIQTAALDEISSSENQLNLATIEVNKILKIQVFEDYLELNTIIGNSQALIDEAQDEYNSNNFIASFKKSKDSQQVTSQIYSDIENIATTRISEVQTQINSLWDIYNDENLNKNSIEDKLDEAQNKVNEAQNTYYDNNIFNEAINVIDYGADPLISQAQEMINDEI